MSYHCPNCEAVMEEGDTCPECDHTEVDACPCRQCFLDAEVDPEEYDVPGGLPEDPRDTL